MFKLSVILRNILETVENLVKIKVLVQVGLEKFFGDQIILKLSFLKSFLIYLLKQKGSKFYFSTYKNIKNHFNSGDFCVITIF